MNLGDRVDLLPVPDLPPEWLGKRGTVVERPADAFVNYPNWVWVLVDGTDIPRAFYYVSGRPEIRKVSALDLIAEAAAGLTK